MDRNRHTPLDWAIESNRKVIEEVQIGFLYQDTHGPVSGDRT